MSDYRNAIVSASLKREMIRRRLESRGLIISRHIRLELLEGQLGLTECREAISFAYLGLVSDFEEYTRLGDKMVSLNALWSPSPSN